MALFACILRAEPMQFIAIRSGITGDSFLASESGRAVFISSAGINVSFNGGPVSMKFADACRNPPGHGLDPQPGRNNYFRGKDPSQWRTGLPRYARVQYSDLYPGIDIVYYGNGRKLEYDLIVSPQADPARIRIEFDHAGSARIASGGDFVFNASRGEVRLRKPVIYQNLSGVRREVPGRYVLKGRNILGFQIGAYDRSRSLVIDPVLTYATYLGGASDETALAVATDAAGNSYAAGYTTSVNFPASSGAYEASPPGGATDIFVAKYSPGGQLVYATYLGGNGEDTAFGIAVDSSGNVYLTGYTSSADFPITSGAYQGGYRGGSLDAFLVKLNAAGNALVYSTYLGGAGEDIGYGITLDATNEPVIAGSTASLNFPVTGGAYATTYAGGVTDGFVVRFNAAGTSLVYSTYLGGAGEDAAYGVALDTHGNAYLTGYTESADFPITPGALQTTTAGGYDAFVTAINATGNALVYSTFLGGTDGDFGFGIATDSSANAYITGYTTSPDYPTTAGAFQVAKRAGYDAVLTKLSPAGSLLYSSYLGGSGDDFGFAVAVDAAQNVYVTGETSSTDLPLVNPIQAALAGPVNAFIAQVNPAWTALSFSTYVGGSGSDAGYGIAVNAQGVVSVAGTTSSANFPVTAGAPQSALAGPSDAYVLSLSFGVPAHAPSSQTITFGALPAHTYGNAPFALTATASSNLAVAFSVASGPCSISSTTITISGAGSCVITATQTGNASYSAAPAVQQTLTISKAVIIVTANSATIVTGAALPALTASLTGFVNGDTASVVSGAPSLTTTATQSSPAGAYPITATVGTLAAANYSFTFVTGTLTIKAPASTSQTITFGALPARTYGNAPFALTATASSNLAVAFSVASGPCSISSTTITISGAGSCVITATQTGNASYSAAPAVQQTLTISKAVIIVTANSATIVTGAALPALTASLTGFVNGDTASVVSGAPSLTTTATQSSPAGAYPITATVGTLAAANYSFTFVTGTLTIASGSPIITGGPGEPSPMSADNSATFVPAMAAPNTILTLFGSDLGCAQSPQVLVNGSAAGILFAGTTQINLVVPGQVSGSNASIEILCNGTTIGTLAIPVAQVDPAIFTETGTGTGQGSIVNLDGTVNTTGNPILAGSYISVYVTGFGPLNAASPDGLRRLTYPVTAAIGGIAATVVYAGEAPGETAGLQQINLQVPPGVVPGPNVAIVLTTDGVSTESGVTVAVQ
jgi:uncharacterized protein (TIGR03437 family)